MKVGKQRTRKQLFRSSKYGFDGMPPKNIPIECFLKVDNAALNGEIWFYRQIKPHIQSLYDVGADTTFYTNFDGEVHYFEPISDSNIFKAERATLQGHNILKNKRSYFNNFGLSSVSDGKLKITWEAGDMLPDPVGEGTLLGDNVFMKTKRGDEYIKENNFSTPDFISTDTEGHELYVLQGFGELLRDVKIIQFEYNSTWYSAGVTMDETISYLKDHGFCHFNYLSMSRPNHGLIPMNWVKGEEDHYAFCNVVCFNERWADKFKFIIGDKNGN